ncbi:MAG: hypothetical protein ACHRXM_24755 [Isosphaerales bacterium]
MVWRPWFYKWEASPGCPIIEPKEGRLLLDAYTNDPDAGIHGAAEWTLRQWNEQAKLKAAEAELRKLKERGDRRWLVNSQGQNGSTPAGRGQSPAGITVSPSTSWRSMPVPQATARSMHRQDLRLNIFTTLLCHASKHGIARQVVDGPE